MSRTDRPGWGQRLWQDCLHWGRALGEGTAA